MTGYQRPKLVAIVHYNSKITCQEWRYANFFSVPDLFERLSMIITPIDQQQSVTITKVGLNKRLASHIKRTKDLTEKQGVYVKQAF